MTWFGPWHGRLVRVWNDRRGTVAVIAALAMPACIGVMALGIDASNWAMMRVQLQRLADVAAMAGASRYAQTLDGPAAVISAANVAELNGVPAGTRTGSGTASLTDNYGNWTTSFGFDETATTITATVQTNAPVWFGRIFTSATQRPIAATAVAQITPRAAGGQACVLALKGDSTGITTIVDITVSGSTTVTSTNCGLRSDGSLTINGNAASISVPTVIASGTIDDPHSGIACPSSTPCQQQGEPQIPDPFLAKYGSQLSIPATGGSPSNSGTTLNPGYYPNGLDLKGSNTLNAGIYYVNGSITINAQANISGSGVTLISSGGMSINGGATVNLTAPSTGATAGLLYGTSSSNASVSLSGNSSVSLTGAVYAPNAEVTFTGNSKSLAGSGPCLEIVASTVTFSGNSGFSNSGCAALGAPVIYNLPPKARLVQ